ncbi:MAG: carboxypeptidase-like regulatory domain-containing protein, partial [Sediminibacterium sp.]
MKNMKSSFFYIRYIIGLFFMLLFIIQLEAQINPINNNDSSSFKYFKGTILDSKSKNELTFASITVSRSNISTISNSEGDFLIKIPIDKQDASLIISYLGYKDKTISIKDLMHEKNIVYLEPIKNLLKEVVVNAIDANKLFSNVLNNRSKNYGDSSIKMVGFYRESIKKRRTYVSVLESIVDIEKKPFSSAVEDQVDILKGRKNVDYSKLDTINFKLEGGLYTALFIDIIKEPINIFSETVFDLYNFRFEDMTQINDKQVTGDRRAFPKPPSPGRPASTRAPPRRLTRAAAHPLPLVWSPGPAPHRPRRPTAPDRPHRAGADPVAEATSSNLYVARDADLAVLKDHWAAARQGEPRFVRLHAPLGGGKRAMVGELARGVA